MSVKTLYAILVDDPGVAALVGTRITPIIRTQDAPLPAITIQRITNSPTNSFDGDAGLDHSRTQVDSWGGTYVQALAVSAAARAAITAAGFTLNLEIDNFAEAAQLSGLFQVTQEYDVWLQLF